MCEVAQINQVRNEEVRWRTVVTRESAGQAEQCVEVHTRTHILTQELDEKKAIGPNRVLGYILKECRQERAEPIHDIIECSLKTGKVPKEWKRTDLFTYLEKRKQKRTT